MYKIINSKTREILDTEIKTEEEALIMQYDYRNNNISEDNIYVEIEEYQ